MTRPLSRETVLETIGVLSLAALAAGLYFRLGPLLYIAGGLLVVGLFLKKPAALIASAWMRFGHVLGTINTRILLAIAFYAVLTPLAFIYRLFHRDALQVRAGTRASSLWHVRDHVYTARDFENMW